MPKRPVPVPNTTAFSIARQFTGPPFSAMLESAELRRHLMEELAHPHEAKAGGDAPSEKPATTPRPKNTRKAGIKGRSKKASK